MHTARFGRKQPIKVAHLLFTLTPAQTHRAPALYAKTTHACTSLVHIFYMAVCMLCLSLQGATFLNAYGAVAQHTHALANPKQRHANIFNVPQTQRKTYRIHCYAGWNRRGDTTLENRWPSKIMRCGILFFLMTSHIYQPVPVTLLYSLGV